MVAIDMRLARDSDVEAIVEIYRPIVESTTLSFETRAPGQEEMARRVHETLQSYPWLVCELEGHVAGYAYASLHRIRGAYLWSVDTSVYIDEGYRRRGVGRGLYESLFAILVAQGYFNAYAGISFRTKPASPCTSQWGSSKSACIAESRTSWAAGATRVGGSGVWGSAGKRRSHRGTSRRLPRSRGGKRWFGAGSPWFGRKRLEDAT